MPRHRTELVARLSVRLPTSLVLLVAIPVCLAPSVFANDYQDISEIAGFVQNDFTYGLAWGDLDGDGDPDLLVGRHFASPLIYENIGDRVFAARESTFVEADHHGMVVVDFDDDGDPDVYLTGGASGGTASLPKHLYRNDGSFVFRNIAAESGIADPLARGRSCSAMDVDRDGSVDLFVANAVRAGQPNSLFRNDGNGQFTDVAEAAGIADGFGSEGGVWGDYDRDGDPDLFVSGIGSPESESRLYRNDGAFVFQDVTASVLGPISAVAAAAWGDVDNDGDLDLALGYGDEGIFDGFQQQQKEIAFFFNARAGDDGVDALTFRHQDEETTFDLQFQGETRNDLVFIGGEARQPTSNPFTEPVTIAGVPPYTPGQSIGFYLWAEPATGTWHVEVSTPAGIGSNFSGILTAGADIDEVTTANLEPPSVGSRGARVFRNDGATFVDVTVSLGLSDSANVRNVTWIDYDQDGDLDLHVHNKGDTFSGNQSDVLYRNDAGNAFEDVTIDQKLEGPTLGLGEGIAFEDFDDDGDPDAALTSGASPRFFALQEQHRLFENKNDTGGFLRVDLEGGASTRDGLGSWVTCVVVGLPSQVRYVTGNAWRGSQVMLQPLFGLGGASTVDTIRVEWPSGFVSEMTSVPAGRVTVVEPASVDAPEIGSPRDSRLELEVTPNPFSSELVFRVRSDSGTASLDVVTVAGRLVYRRALSPDAPVDMLSWDGRDRAGRPLAAGVDYAVLRQGPDEVVRKVVRLR